MKSWLKSTFRTIHGFIKRVLSRNTCLTLFAAATVGVACAPTIGNSVMGSVVVKAFILLTFSDTLDLLRSDSKARALYSINGLLSTAGIGFICYAIATGSMAFLSGVGLIILILFISSFFADYTFEKIELEPTPTSI